MHEASNVAATNEQVRRYFEALMEDGFYELTINGEAVYLDSPQDVDMAYLLFLASPQPNQEYRRDQAKTFFRDSKIFRSAA